MLWACHVSVNSFWWRGLLTLTVGVKSHCETGLPGLIVSQGIKKSPETSSLIKCAASLLTHHVDLKI